MLRVLHISDLHFGPPYVPAVGQALLQIAPELEPDVIVVSGDLTQRAKSEQFVEAKAFIDQLPPAPRVIIPGNHDVPLYRVGKRMTRPHECYQAHIQEELNHVVKVDGAVFVALDSTSPRRAISNGRVHVEQLDFCTESLRDAHPDDAKIIVAHHHFAPAPDYERDQTMPKARRAMNRFTELGVDMILGGHLHRAYIGNSLDFYPGNVRDRGIIIVQSGTTTSRRGRGREREKNSFNLICIGREMVDITHYLYFDADEKFAPLSRHFFPRPGKRLVEFTVNESTSALR